MNLKLSLCLSITLRRCTGSLEVRTYVLDVRMCQFHTPTTLFPHKKFRTYCIKEWVRISTGVDITVKRNISDPDRN